MMPEERKVTIDGDIAILHPWRHDSNELRIDYSAHVAMIGEAVSELELNNKPQLIGIEGKPGSGKTNLAKVTSG